MASTIGLLVGGCTNGNPPTDDELMAIFLAHEDDFHDIHDIIRNEAIAEDAYYNVEFDSLNDQRFRKGDYRQRLDSLLNEINCNVVRGYGPGHNTIYFLYYSTLGGTSKKILYDRSLSGKVQITEGRELNDICRECGGDTLLYKHIKGDWYIELNRD